MIILKIIQSQLLISQFNGDKKMSKDEEKIIFHLGPNFCVLF